jgi:hypothetical protein
VRDAVAAHNEGIPTVVLVHGPFEKLAKTQCAALGAADLPLLIYKQDALARDTDGEIVGKAAEAAGRLPQFLMQQHAALD